MDAGINEFGDVLMFEYMIPKEGDWVLLVREKPFGKRTGSLGSATRVREPDPRVTRFSRIMT